MTESASEPGPGAPSPDASPAGDERFLAGGGVLVADLPALELEKVSAAYGRYRALFDVSLSVDAGSATALVGPNGAGKSTIARVATGLVPVTSGRIRIGGRDVTGWPAFRIARLGVAHAPEGRSVFASLDVEDNLLLTFRRVRGRREAFEALARAYERFPRLAERRHQLAGTLSGGEQRMLALARVLAIPPKLLVVDELSLGLAPKVVDEVFRALADIKAAGTSLLVVEQHIPRALEIADKVAILRKGRVVHAGPSSELGDLAESILPVRADDGPTEA